MKLKSLLAVGAFLACGSASAASVAILTGSFYTPNLANQLTSAGQTVTEISGSYTASSLSGYNAVVFYGSGYVYNPTELTSYVNSGGVLIQTPWGMGYGGFADPLSTYVISGTGINISNPYPGVNVLDPGNALLAGVTFPASYTNIGWVTPSTFTSGATQVASYGDSSAMIGSRPLGAGTVVAINLQVITSDTPYTVINQPWATQLFVNAVNLTPTSTSVPEPGTLLLAGIGLMADRKSVV